MALVFGNQDQELFTKLSLKITHFQVIEFYYICTKCIQILWQKILDGVLIMNTAMTKLPFFKVY